MRRLEVELRPSAVHDLRELQAYIVHRAGDRGAGRRFMARLRTWCRKLGDTPLIGATRDDLEPGLRVVGVARRASIVFRVERDRLVIVNVLYGGRDLEAFYRRGGSEPA